MDAVRVGGHQDHSPATVETEAGCDFERLDDSAPCRSRRGERRRGRRRASPQSLDGRTRRAPHPPAQAGPQTSNHRMPSIVAAVGWIGYASSPFPSALRRVPEPFRIDAPTTASAGCPMNRSISHATSYDLRAKTVAVCPAPDAMADLTSAAPKQAAPLVGRQPVEGVNLRAPAGSRRRRRRSVTTTSVVLSRGGDSVTNIAG
jgi:hypothetical protein